MRARRDPRRFDHRLFGRGRGDYNVRSAHRFFRSLRRPRAGLLREFRALGLAAAPYANVGELAHFANRFDLRVSLKPAADDGLNGRIRSRQNISGVTTGSAGADLPENIRLELSQRLR